MDLITFKLQELPDCPDRLYGIELSAELEVVALGPITKVPLAPSAIVGAMNNKGHVVALIDLAQVLEDRSTLPRPGDPSILVRAGGCRLVFCVHRILDVHRGELATNLAGAELEVICGRMETAAGPVYVLHLERLVDQLTSQIAAANTPFQWVTSGVETGKQT